jgi:Flp pilus assembly protein TadD
MAKTGGQNGNFWSTSDALTKQARPWGSKQFAAEAMKALRRGDVQRAVDNAAKAVSFDPVHPEANLTMAIVMETAGRLAEAETFYGAALVQDPNSIGALIGMGRLKLNQRRAVDAMTALARAVKVSPNNVDALHLQARAFGLLMRFDEAAAAFEAANRQKPNDPEILAGYGRALANLGRTEEALELYRQAEKLNPRSDAVVQGMASILLDTGKAQEAVTLLRKAVALNPRRPGAYEQLARLGELTGTELETARKFASDPKLPPLDGASFKFAVGTALLREGKNPEAFSHLHAASAVRDQGRRYEKARVEALVEAVIDSMAVLPNRANSDTFDQPLFIMGMPRSGTTLVEQIFAKHSRVFAAGERARMGELRRRLLKQAPSYRGALQMVTPEISAAMRGGYFAGLPAHATTALRVTDKMPDNIWNLPLIRTLFPAARVLICRRHPLDICWSIFQQGFGPQVGYASNLTNIANHLASHDRIIRKWLVEDNGLTREVLYEELVHRFADTARELVAFAGLDWEDACLDLGASDRSIRTASAQQVRQKVHTDSIGRWRAFAEELAPQAALLADQIADHERKLKERGIELT